MQAALMPFRSRILQGDVELSDLCCEAVRGAMPWCDARELRLLFDHAGPPVRWGGDAENLRHAMRRIFDAAIEILQDGFVFFTARADACEAGGCELTVVAAATGRYAEVATRRRVLERLRLQGVDEMSDDSLLALREPVSGSCPLTGGHVRFAIDPVEGSLFSLQLLLPDAVVLADDTPDAAGARAWVIAHQHAWTQGVERRLQRLGWRLRTFATVEEAAAEAVAMPQSFRRPALVLGFEQQGITVERLRSLWSLLPPATEMLLLASPDSPTLQPLRGGASNGPVSVKPTPLSPQDLSALTQRAALQDDEVSGLTRPAPLGFEQRRRALVVDDNEVNQMVASGMLQVLGFEVDTANDGAQAIDRCMAGAFDLVLMDLHMPGMDGLEATRRLRLLQAEGAIPPCLIVAATADTTAQAACVEAGMDAHLPKPLDLAGLESYLKRLMPMAF
jgi:CheY-like chemotaxis protein